MRDRSLNIGLVKGKNVCLVGNSRSILGKDMGTIIDSHDVVIRFNKFKTLSQEDQVGAKTTVWIIGAHHGRHDMGWMCEYFENLQKLYDVKHECLSGKMIEPFEPFKMKELWILPSIVNPCTLISDDDLACVPEYVSIKDFHHRKHIKKAVEILDKRNPDKLLTSGFRVLQTLMNFREDIKELSIAGFGSNKPEDHEKDYAHYFESPDRFDADYVKKVEGIHDMKLEREIHQGWIDKGLLTRLEDEA